MAVNMKKYRFVGLDKDVWLPDDIAVEIKIIDHPRFRSYTRDTQQIYTVYHDTGNPNTNARGEYAWAAGVVKEVRLAAIISFLMTALSFKPRL